MTISKYFWKLTNKYYPYIRSFLLMIKVLRHKGRQAYLIGNLKARISKEKFKNFLERFGYEYINLAWVDDGEILSMRKKVGKVFQYHIRLFKDREIRAHFEYAPDCKPIDHIREVVFKSRKNYFRRLLEEFIF